MKPNFFLKLLLVTFVGMLFLNACSSEVNYTATEAASQAQASAPADAVFTLKTIVGDGKIAYIGVGGEIDGIINPDLLVQPGATVRLVLVNGDGMQHDISLPDFGVKSDYVYRLGDKLEIYFNTGDQQAGSYAYFCTVPGHRQAGQEGKLVVVAP